MVYISRLSVIYAVAELNPFMETFKIALRKIGDARIALTYSFCIAIILILLGNYYCT